MKINLDERLRTEELLTARNKAADLFDAIISEGIIQPGTSESLLSQAIVNDYVPHFEGMLYGNRGGLSSA
jgi:hypothetical protein